MILLLNIFGNLFRKEPESDHGESEIATDELMPTIDLVRGETVLVYNDRQGAKIWKYYIAGMGKAKFMIISRESTNFALPFKEGQNIQLGVFRGEQIGKFVCKLAENVKNRKPPGLIFFLPRDVSWKTMLKRKFSRIDVNLPAKIRLDIPGRPWVDGFVKDMCRAGMCFLSTEPINQRVKVRVKIASKELPHEIKGTMTRMLQISSTPHKGRLNYNMGIKFEGNHPKVDEAVCDFLWRIQYGGKK